MIEAFLKRLGVEPQQMLAQYAQLQQQAQWLVTQLGGAQAAVAEARSHFDGELRAINAKLDAQAQDQQDLIAMLEAMGCPRPSRGLNGKHVDG